MNFYENEALKIVDPKLFSENAKEVAKKISSKDDKKDNSSQIRKFYDEFLKYSDMVKMDKSKFKECLPLIHMLVAKVAYAKGRKVVSDDFVQFVTELVNQVKDEKDLAIAALYFESVVAYYKYLKA